MGLGGLEEGGAACVLRLDVASDGVRFAFQRLLLNSSVLRAFGHVLPAASGFPSAGTPASDLRLGGRETVAVSAHCAVRPRLFGLKPTECKPGLFNGLLKSGRGVRRHFAVGQSRWEDGPVVRW